MNLFRYVGPLLCVVMCTLNPQKSNAEKINEAPLSTHIASGLSVSNTGDASFKETSYFSAEFGLTKGALSLGLALGRSDNDYTDQDTLMNYWWEIKTALAVPVDSFSVYGLLGLGHYLSTERVFIEYGIGVSHSWDPLSFFAQVSNWDGLWYVTPGLSYTF